MEQYAITGVGVISPLGENKEEFWSNIENVNNGFEVIQSFDMARFDCKVGGILKGFDAKKHIQIKGLRYLDKMSQMSLCAASMALDDSHFITCEKDKNECGIALGNSLGSLSSIMGFDINSIINGYSKINPPDFANTVINAQAGHISINLGLTSRNVTISNGFSSSLDGLIYSIESMQRNKMKMMLVGGVEELSEFAYLYYDSMDMLGNYSDVKDAKSFVKKERGTVLGEGAAFFAVETLENAKERGARIYGKVIGYSSGFDFDESGNILCETITDAIKSSGKVINDIDIILSSQNGTEGDKIEMAALESIFKDKLKDIPVYRIKELTGETCSAAGAFQIIAALGILEKDKKESHKIEGKRPRTVLVNNFEKGSGNTVIVIEDYIECSLLQYI